MGRRSKKNNKKSLAQKRSRLLQNAAVEPCCRICGRRIGNGEACGCGTPVAPTVSSYTVPLIVQKAIDEVPDDVALPHHVAEVAEDVLSILRARTLRELMGPLPEYSEVEFGQFGSAAARPTISIAPMMAWTDHHYRQLVRLIERQSWLDHSEVPCAEQQAKAGVLLVTEMLEAERIHELQQDDPEGLRRMISFRSEQQPIAAQIGGSSAAKLANAARCCAEAGYREVDLNVGCPSNSVCGNGFGVSLMKDPEHVAKIVAEIRRAVPET